MVVQRWFLYRAARFAFNFARSADFRSVMLLRFRNPANLFQPFSDTCLDRYPDIFRFARERIGDSESHRILSFGCATGEEVLTLHRYFPLAAIDGVDINRRSIARAKRMTKEVGGDRLRFCVGHSAGATEGLYDAVFCMSVFRHGGLGAVGKNNRCDHLIRFDDFARTVNELARRIKPGGLFFIVNSNFRFGDTATSKEFEVVWRDRSAPETRSSIFGPDNCLASMSYDEIGFRKRS